jgi:hypothetical protein
MNTAVLRIASVLLLCVGCATSGPPFEAVREVPPGKALVYIYRPSGLIGGGVRYHVAARGERIVFLKPGGYFPYIAEPGEIEFWAQTEAKDSITTDLEPGETYYLKGTVGVGMLVGRPRFEFVDESRGWKEIRECVLLPPAAQAVPTGASTGAR